MKIFDFVKFLFVGFVSLLLLQNKTSSYTDSDAETHEEKLFAFIHKNISLSTAVLSCYDSERHFGKVLSQNHTSNLEKVYLKVPPSSDFGLEGRMLQIG